MGSPYEIARYGSEHKEQVLGLLRHLWGRHAGLNRSYFDWKYERNPYIPDPAISLALHRGEVVGMYGLVGARWQLGASGRRQDIPYPDDLVVAPAHRRQGLAGSLIRAVSEHAAALGFPYVLSLRANPITLRASLAAGYRRIGDLDPVLLRSGRARVNLHRVSRLLRQVPYAWRHANSPLLLVPSDRRPFGGLDRAARRPDAGRSPHVSLGPTPRVADMAELVERLPADDRIHHVRDREYLDWVFANPRIEYRFLYWERDSLEGFLVLHRVGPARASLINVWVSDWEGSSDVIRAQLLRAAVSGGFARLATWTTTFPEADRAVLRELGFEPMDAERRSPGWPAALIRPNRDDELDGAWTSEGRPLLDASQWKFRPLDQD